MKDSIKLLIVIAVVACIAFPILVYFEIEPFAYYGKAAYAFLVSKATTSMATVTGLVGVTGVSTAAAAALAFAYSQKSKVVSWAKTQLTAKEAAITDLTSQTSKLSEVSKLKDDAFTKIAAEKESISTELTGLKGQYASMQGQLKTQEENTQALLTKNSALLNDAISNKIPKNEIFTSATDPTKQLLVVKEKYIT